MRSNKDRSQKQGSADLRPALAGGLRFFLRFALSNPRANWQIVNPQQGGSVMHEGCEEKDVAQGSLSSLVAFPLRRGFDGAAK